MNKPATKEPSMDEILSSIRQIIADDDAAVAPPPARPPVAAAPAPKPAAPAPAPAPIIPPAAAKPPAAAPLALSAAQMVDAPAPVAPKDDLTAMLAEFKMPEAEADPAASFMTDEPELVDPEDVAFEPEPEPEMAPEPEPEPLVLVAPEPVAPPPRMELPRQDPPAPPTRPATSVAQAAPLPDPTLSSDMAEELLAPATDAAIQGSISRLSSIAQVGGMGGQTVEGMMRELLRPMLKDWLDENLPALVERMVEKEIARISRGVK